MVSSHILSQSTQYNDNPTPDPTLPHKAHSAEKTLKGFQLHITHKARAKAKRKRSHVTDSTQPILRQTTEVTQPTPMNWKTQREHNNPTLPVNPVSLPSHSVQGNLLKDKAMEIWLNDLILEHRGGEETSEKAGLKRFGMDRSTLMFQGVSAENISRIYKMLYVYSAGFSGLVKELSLAHPHTVKNIWMVFVRLLEWTCWDELAGVIGELEREKEAKVRELEGQVELQQAAIAKHALMESERKKRSQEQNKLLMEVNEQLSMDKMILKQDYEDSEKAFSQEISLRMLFENKIAQLHSVNVEITIKQQKLLKDLQKKYIDEQKLRDLLGKERVNRQ